MTLSGTGNNCNDCKVRVFPLLNGPSCFFHVHVNVDQSAASIAIRRDSCENEAVVVFSRTHIKQFLSC